MKQIEISSMQKLFKCKCHNRNYLLCSCGKQYCLLTWGRCPRCGK